MDIIFSHMKKNQSVAVSLTDVSKKYKIHHEKPTLVEKFIHGKNETFWALQDINLTIHSGERVGIIGHNGSGKTTLLKIITGITTPTHGKILTNGKIVSLIDLEAGFHGDLTGEQNIYLNGMLLGMTKKEIESKIRQIIAFADLKQFIDAPLFTYSNGMALRLGFAIAINADPDILILDESVVVGDIDFQKKAQRKIEQLFKENKTIILAAHWLEFIEKNCDRIIQIEKSRIIHDGNVKLLANYRLYK